MLALIDAYLLTIIAVFLPAIAVLGIALLRSPQAAKIFAFGISLLIFVGSLYLYQQFDGTSSELQFVEKYSWFPTYGINYLVAVDGLSLLLIMLTALLTPLLILSLWHAQQNQRALLALLMFLTSGMLGALIAFDLLLFYIFWEIMLIPMYFIIGIWGGKNKLYATTKFFIYTASGSLFMLVAAIVLYGLHYQEFGVFSTNLLDLYQLHETKTLQYLLFLGFMLAFAIKIPLWPFHTWLPDAHTEAPTVGSVVLAAVMLKLGIYGLMRFAIPLFPQAVIDCAPFLLGFGVIGIIYGALTAWAQQDAKKMIAYSSVSHLGFVVVGTLSLSLSGEQLSEIALTGALYQMINHGISTGALFFLIGTIYERCHTRMIADYGGLASSMPIFATMLIIATLGSIGLPGTGGFVGEFYILLGAFQAQPFVAVCASFGVLLGAIYMLSLCRRLLFGKCKNDNIQDLSKLEVAYLLPLIILVILTGILPEIFLQKTKPSLQHLARNFLSYQLTSKENITTLSPATLAEQDK